MTIYTHAFSSHLKLINNFITKTGIKTFTEDDSTISGNTNVVVVILLNR